MIRLYGIPVTEADCATLVDLLLRVGRADDLTAATTLTPEERDAILGVLDDPPDGLVELRGVLARDHRDRQG